MSTRDRHLVLVVPGLYGPETDPPASEHLRDSRPAALDRLLSRSRVTAGSGNDLDATLGRLFGLAADADQELPAAVFTWLADTGQPPVAWLMRADPVHLRADQSCLRLFDTHSFTISREEADALVAAFNAHFRDAGWKLMAPNPQRWYLSLPQPPSLQTVPPARVAGQDVDPCLPRGADAARWHALLNEIQMLFHTHPVNATREQCGAPPVNSIWPWGGGHLPGVLAPPAMRLLADHPLATGLARHAGLSFAHLPATVEEVLAMTGDGRTLLIDDRLEWPMHYRDIENWLDNLLALETGWFAPLLAALQDGALGTLEIHPCKGHSFHVNRGCLRRFWKPVRPYEENRPLP